MFASSPKRKPFIAVARLSTLVAEGVEIDGDVTFGGGMRIDGRVRGDVVGRSADDGNGAANDRAEAPALLVLSAKGRIDGNIRCGDAVINGTVTGDLDVEHRLELQSDARVCGTIRYRALQMDVGATVQGSLHKVENGLGGNVVELGADKAERR